MEKSAKKNLVNDIENRLDDFFGETPPSEPAAEEPVSMEKLKSLVLSIDWEITDTCLADLISETDVLLPQYANDRLAHTLLRMLRAVGRYIRLHKAQAHPDAIKRIMSVFAGLEQLTGNPQMSEDEKKQVVAREIAAFKRLKSQVEVKRGADSQPYSSDEKIAAGGGFVQNHELELAMSTIEKRLNSQIADLKKQLSGVQKELANIRKK